MTDKKTEALKLALEALKQIDEAMPFPVAKLAQQVIREALAEQPAPGSHLTDEQKAANGLAWLARLEALREEWAGLAEQPAQQQEPVALQMDVIVVNLVREGINKHRARELAEHFIKQCNYTSPQPSKPWVGLTDEEIERVCIPLGAAMLSFTEVARAIEAKLKEKNA